MQSDQINFSALCDQVGRSDVSTNFYNNSYEYSSHEKQHQREAVLAYILSKFNEDDPLRILTLPGERWVFEMMLLSEHYKSHVVGLERSVTTFAKSAPGMVSAEKFSGKEITPIRLGGRFQRHRIKAFGSAEYQYYRTPTDFSIRDRSHRLLNMELSTYLSMIYTDYGQEFSDIEKFREKFMRRNCAWIDLTGNLNPSFLGCLKDLDIAFTPGIRDQPIAFTFFYGRDMSGGEDARLDAIASRVNSYSIEKYWRYRGANDAPMMTVCGVMDTTKPDV